jgi:hypothetical protein
MVCTECGMIARVDVDGTLVQKSPKGYAPASDECGAGVAKT